MENNIVIDLTYRRMGMETIIEVSHLNKTYKKRRERETIQAVNNISFKVNKGEILGLLGPNGA